MAQNDFKTARLAPITKDNPAVVAYITLVVASDMRQDGMWMIASALEKAGAAMALEHGRLPAGTHIPDDVWQEVYDSVVEMTKQQCAKAAMDAAAKHPKH